MSGSNSGYVQPNVACPHLSHLVEKSRKELLEINPELAHNLAQAGPSCRACDNRQENWVCLECYVISCGRFARGHAVAHQEETGHCIAFGLADLSCWCYACEAYLSHLHIAPVASVYSVFHRLKFNQEVPGSSPPSHSQGPRDAVEALEDEVEQGASVLPRQERDSDSDDEDADGTKVEGDEKNEQAIEDLLARLQNVSSTSSSPSEAPMERPGLESFAAALRERRVKNVILCVGAGISVSAGIPDFRTPGTGLYDNLAKYNLPEPMAIFELNYFKTNPKPFCLLAKELYPGAFQPTPTHHFIKLLADKGLLRRCYTQNIDGLEFLAGIPKDLVVQAHGGFQTAHCLGCQKQFPESFCKDAVFADQIPRCTECNALVKPDIVFFGEALPARFGRLVAQDFPECDCLIVMGTSLQVQPFASLINRAPENAIRLLVNREKVGLHSPMMAFLGGGSGFKFDSSSNRRDVFLQGDCDSGTERLCELLGWSEELKASIAAGFQPQKPPTLSTPAPSPSSPSDQ